MKFKFTYFFVGLLFLNCHKEIPVVFSNSTPINFNEVFEQFWSKMNSNYVYWDIDTTDWNKIYKFYKPLFQNLNFDNAVDQAKSVLYFKQMTNKILDGHYTINFINPAIKDSFIYPASNRKQQSLNYHQPFFYASVDTNYLDVGFHYGYFLTSQHQLEFAACGVIQSKILFFTCNQFSLEEAYQSRANNEVKNTMQYFFDKISNLPASLKGIIIDVRNNSGGNIADLNFFIGRMIDKPLQFGYTRYKGGVGSLDYLPWINATILPKNQGKKISLPIVVLADSYSISLAEIVTMSIKLIPNSIFIGEQTWGATGPITDNAAYTSGPFTIPNVLKVNTSSSEFKYIDNKSYESIGFPPDFSLPFDLKALLNKKDPQLEKAITLIKK